MKQQEIFSRLVENSFDFLNKALDEFEDNPKYSVINFYSAIELILKARLLREHWSLVVHRIESANYRDFLTGNFQSVNLKEAKKRLENIVQDGITDQQFELFQKLAGHRNRMVHFFHTTEKTDVKELEDIVIEQCHVWFNLYILMRGHWHSIFEDYQDQVKEIEGKMAKHQKYLQAKFDSFQTVITKMKSEGAIFTICPWCEFNSLEVKIFYGPILEYFCLVCVAGTYGIDIECSSCSRQARLIYGPEPSCDCGHEFTQEEIRGKIGLPITKDEIIDKHIANCGDCIGHQTVVPVGDDHWACSKCFTPFKSEDINGCGFCGDYSTADMEDSYIYGCEYCEGKLAWEGD